LREIKGLKYCDLLTIINYSVVNQYILKSVNKTMVVVVTWVDWNCKSLLTPNYRSPHIQENSKEQLLYFYDKNNIVPTVILHQ